MNELKKRLMELAHTKRVSKQVREALLDAHQALATLELSHDNMKTMAPYFSEGHTWFSINAHDEPYTLFRLVRDGVVRVASLDPKDRLFVGRANKEDKP